MSRHASAHLVGRHSVLVDVPRPVLRVDRPRRRGRLPAILRGLLRAT